jgi:phosphohistidine phosphatase
MAEFLARADLVVSTICHSGKLRARQTAELLASYVVPSEGIVERGDLNPNDPVEPVVQTLGQGLKDVMIVGHLPFLGRLASATLLGSGADILAFRPGSVVCLESDDGSRWRLAWMVTPEIVR